MAATVSATREARQLEEQGYCVFPAVYSAELVGQLRSAIDEGGLLAPDAIAAYEANPFQGIWGLQDLSASSADASRVIPRLLSWEPALAALRQAGVTNPRFTSGYSLSKPGGGPALYWHRDWHYWSSEPESAMPRATQLFLMLYLVDTTPTNGCLKVLPRSHLSRVGLDDLIPVESARAHGGRNNWGEDLAKEPALANEVQELVASWPSSVDVAVKAGDLVIGDSRMFHAAHANCSDKRRTCLTMWYVDWDQCTPELRAAYAGNHGSGFAGEVDSRPCGIECASEIERALLRPLCPAVVGVDEMAAEAVVPNRMMGEWGRRPIVPTAGETAARL